jgi:hypothetical protein
MGNLNSIYKIYNSNNKTKNPNCLLCNKKTELHNLVQCHRCHIKLHDYCYDIHSAERTYAVCPNPECKKLGTLGQELYYKNKYLEEQKKEKNKTKE